MYVLIGHLYNFSLEISFLLFRSPLPEHPSPICPSLSRFFSFLTVLYVSPHNSIPAHAQTQNI